MKWLRQVWRQLWCFHYWRKSDDQRFVSFRRDEWMCVYCGKIVVADWDKPPLSYVE